MDDERLSELEAKWLKGTISDAEALEYANWYNTNYDQQVVVPDDIGTTREEHAVAMFQKITGEMYKQKKKVYNTAKKYMVGACVLLLISIVILIYLNQKQTNNQSPTNDALPGKEGMELLLQNGEKIIIDSNRQGLLASYKGVDILQQNGSVIYKGGGLDSMYATATTPLGKKYKLTLPDGSIAWMNAGSTVTYPLQFANQHRTLQVTGEVLFNVVTNTQQPFIVNVGKQQIKVTGTRFSVKAYADEQVLITTLIEGKITVATPTQELALQPGQEVVIEKQTNAAQVNAVNTNVTASWANGKFRYDNTPLSVIMKDIARWYRVEVTYANGANGNTTFTGSTGMDQNLSAVLKVLELSGVKFKITGNQITVLP